MSNSVAAAIHGTRLTSTPECLTYTFVAQGGRPPGLRVDTDTLPYGYTTLAPARTPPTTGGSNQTVWASFMCSARSGGSREFGP